MANTILVSNILTRVKQILADEEGGARWQETSELIPFVNDGVRWLFQLRPDAFLSATGSMEERSDVDEATDTIPIDDSFREPLAWYVVSRARMMEDPEKHNLAAAQEARAYAMSFVLGGAR
jgi:hypothetical protein